MGILLDVVVDMDPDRVFILNPGIGMQADIYFIADPSRFHYDIGGAFESDLSADVMDHNFEVTSQSDEYHPAGRRKPF
jgi:hypothetical protein